MDYFDWSNFGTGAQKRFTSQTPFWGSGEMSNPFEQEVMQGTDLFKQQFKNLLGRDPTPDELGQFQVNALAGALPNAQNPGYGALSGLASSYIQNQFGPQAADYQKKQQTQQLGQSENQLQDIVNKTMSNTTSALTDPNSQIYQKLAGSMNNLGITPSSGAFQAGVGSTIANSGLNAANAGLQAIGIPGIQNIAGLTSVPYEQSFSSGQNAISDLNSLRDFNLESVIAQQLFNQSQPSGFEKDLGYANTASSILANLGKGYSSVGKPTWICTAMWRNKVLAACEVDRLHHHLFKSFFRRFFKFMEYFILGRVVVFMAERKGVDWHDWRTMFYDRVIAEPDSLKAVALYEEAFWQLFRWCAETKYKESYDGAR